MSKRRLLTLSLVTCVVLAGAACQNHPPSSPTTAGTTNATGHIDLPVSSLPAMTSMPRTTSTADSLTPSAPGTAPAVGPFDTAPTTHQPMAPASARTHISGVRVGHNDGFDRVVVDFADGSATSVGWVSDWISNPRTQGKGDPIDLPGKATLRVIVRELDAEPNGQTPPKGYLNQSAPVISGLYLDPVFEGQAVMFVSIADTQRPYRIFTFDNPPRLIIDIQNS